MTPLDRTHFGDDWRWMGLGGFGDEHERGLGGRVCCLVCLRSLQWTISSHHQSNVFPCFI